MPAAAGGLAILVVAGLAGAAARRSRGTERLRPTAYRPSRPPVDVRSHQPVSAGAGFSPPDPSRAPGWWAVPAAAAAAALLLVAGLIAVVGLQPKGREVAGPAAADEATRAAAALSPPPSAATSPTPGTGPPVRLEIPAVGVGAGVDPLGLRGGGELDVPARFDRVGWWSGGPAPGAPGPAVLVGHVDSRRGPAVFFRLRDLVPGDELTVRRDDGLSVTFTVERSASYAKAQFPTAEVYGPRDRSVLRLVTCSGRFDRSTGHYEDNLVVFAVAKGGAGLSPPARAN